MNPSGPAPRHLLAHVIKWSRGAPAPVLGKPGPRADRLQPWSFHGELAVAPARDWNGARATPPARSRSIPRACVRLSLLGFALLASACSPTTEAPAPDKSLTAESQFPKTLDSTAAAESWARNWYTGGRVDEIQSGPQRHLVVFMHGSGVPVIRIALYAWRESRWTLVGLTPPPAGAAEFLRAHASDEKIILTGERTGRTWPLPRPGSDKD